MEMEAEFCFRNVVVLQTSNLDDEIQFYIV
jgi:hypothetical protein